MCVCVCVYLQIVLPDRTKHCKLCEHCCNGFDHHCMWLMSCIGKGNHRMFVMFLFLLSFDNFLFVKECISCEYCIEYSTVTIQWSCSDMCALTMVNNYPAAHMCALTMVNNSPAAQCAAGFKKISAVCIILLDRKI